jgi:hypothetical protein
MKFSRRKLIHVVVRSDDSSDLKNVRVATEREGNVHRTYKRKVKFGNDKVKLYFLVVRKG